MRKLLPTIAFSLAACNAPASRDNEMTSDQIDAGITRQQQEKTAEKVAEIERRVAVIEQSNKLTAMAVQRLAQRPVSSEPARDFLKEMHDAKVEQRVQAVEDQQFLEHHARN